MNPLIFLTMFYWPVVVGMWKMVSEPMWVQDFDPEDWETKVR